MREVLQYCRDRLPERAFASGETIMTEGTPAGLLFVLVEGAVEVLKGDFHVTTVTEPGAIFGEISVLLEGTHTATVRASEPSRFYVIEDPNAFLRSAPDVALAVARLLAKRLAAMMTYLVDLKKQFEEHDDHFGMLDEVLEALAHAQPEDHKPGSDRDPDPTVY